MCKTIKIKVIMKPQIENKKYIFKISFLSMSVVCMSRTTMEISACTFCVIQIFKCTLYLYIMHMCTMFYILY